jgi:hypothetical protein
MSGVPEQAWITEQKKKWPRLSRTTVSGVVYVYRPLMRDEYDQINKDIPPQMTSQGPILTPDQTREMEEKVSELCVLWPVNFKSVEATAGAATVLAGCISDFSGFHVDEEPVEL